MTNNNYEKAIEVCRRTSLDEFTFACDTLQKVGSILLSLEKESCKLLPKKGKNPSESEEKMLMEELNEKISEVLETYRYEKQQSLINKKNRLDKFTVILFGRTMAGKSTIREALTMGDGGTIGKGAQRTTRDIREYDWNGVKIIDTPGIGAYDGEEDKELALSKVDESDVVIFLCSSDSIQEESFLGMQAIRDKNKPMIIVLNVKHDLTKRIYRKQMLKNPESYLGYNAVKGHINRINMLAKKYLNMNDISIIPIHAQSAFLATQEQDLAVRDELWQVSRINNLQKALENEVCLHGPIRRVQTLVDGTVNDLDELHRFIDNNIKDIINNTNYIQKKAVELERRLNIFIKEVKRDIPYQIAAFFYPLRSSISSFVDDNLENSDAGDKWVALVKSQRIEQKCEEKQKHIVKKLKGLLEGFSNEMKAEYRLLGEMNMGGPKQFNSFNYKRALKWTSSISGLGSAISFSVLFFGGANFWNPIGWATLGVCAVSSIFSHFFEDREAKLQRAKSKEAAKLRKQVSEYEKKITGDLMKWFKKSIEKKVISTTIKAMHNQHKSMGRLASLMEKTNVEISSIIDDMNKHLVAKVAGIKGQSIDEDSMLRVVRIPGYQMKIVFNNGQKPLNGLAEHLSELMNEYVNIVEAGNIKQAVVSALYPAVVNLDEVRISGNYAEVKPAPTEIGKALGRNGRNIKLASKLLDMEIKIVSN